MTYIRRITLSVLLLSVVAGSSFLLLRISGEAWIPTPREILDAPPQEAVYGCVWLITLAVLAWLLCSILLSVCAYMAGIPAAIRTVEWMTIRPVRRLSRRLAALIMAIGSFLPSYPAGAAQAPPIPMVATYEQETEVDSTRPLIPGVSIPALAGVAGETLPGGIGVSTGMLPTVGHRPQMAGETVEYVVQPGDSMWSVSADHVRRSQAGPVSGTEVMRVWRQVVDLNRDRIRSGDPDLIYPGEILVLPWGSG